MALIYFLRLIRFYDVCLIGITLFIIKIYFIDFITKNIDVNTALQNSQFYLLIISICCIAAAGFSINNYFDIKRDKSLSLNKNPVGFQIERRMAIAIHLVLNIIGLLLAIYVANSVGKINLCLIQATTILILWQYSVSLKKQFLIGNLMLSILVAIGILLIPVYDLIPVISKKNILILEESTVLFKFIFKVLSIFSYCFFTLTLIYEIIKDIRNLELDESLGFTTLPIRLGTIKAKYLVAILTSTLLTLISYFVFIGNINLIVKFYLIISFYFPLFFVIYMLVFNKTKEQYTFSLYLLKGIMFSLVCLFVLIYYTE